MICKQAQSSDKNADIGHIQSRLVRSEIMLAVFSAIADVSVNRCWSL
jgi:hypothetical protein